MKDKINIELEEWQVKTLRSYFGLNDKTQVEHWAFKVFDDALKKQLTLSDDVVGKNNQLVCPDCKLSFTKEELETKEHCFNCGWEFAK